MLFGVLHWKIFLSPCPPKEDKMKRYPKLLKWIRDGGEGAPRKLSHLQRTKTDFLVAISSVRSHWFNKPTQACIRIHGQSRTPTNGGVRSKGPRRCPKWAGKGPGVWSWRGTDLIRQTACHVVHAWGARAEPRGAIKDWKWKFFIKISKEWADFRVFHIFLTEFWRK